MRMYTAAFALLASSITAVGWTDDAPVPSTSAAKAADIRRLLELTGGSKIGDRMLDELFDMQRREMPEVPDEVWTEARRAFLTRDLLDLVADVWDRHFTHEEIRGLITFYESPLGTRLRQMQPEILQESRFAGEEWARRGLERLQESLRQKGFAFPVRS